MRDIRQWLETLGLERYADAFEANDIDGETLPELDHQLLKELGVKSVGHRVRLLKAIAESPGDNDPVTDAPPSVSEFDGGGEVERRQLTVMFCDLVGSTELSQTLDPEDLRDIMQAYQEAATRIIVADEGFVARYMGDGVLAYFGYPHAHEDDATRAVRTALSLTSAISGLPVEVPLSVRIGIATGAVVVGDLIGDGASEERAVAGVTPNLAARLQGLAEAGETVVDATTRRHAVRRVRFRGLGERALKGFEERVPAFAVVGLRDEVAPVTTPMHGRAEELGLIGKRWRAAVGGRGQLVHISAPPGLGKSRLVQAVKDEFEGEFSALIELYGSPYHVNVALHPMAMQFTRVTDIGGGSNDTERTRRIEAYLDGLGLLTAERTALLCSLLSMPAPSGVLDDLEPSVLRRRTLALLDEVIEHTATPGPVLLVAEDLHWFDPTSIESLGRLLENSRDMSLLMVVTHRPEFHSTWTENPNAISISLNHIGETESAAIAAGFSDRPLAPDLLAEIVRKADGVPLFVEELTRTVLETGAEKASVTVPSTLHGSLMARLDRLGPAKLVAQAAAVLGRRFEVPALRAVLKSSDVEIDGAIQQLLATGLIYRVRSDASESFEFKHALVRDIAYESLLLKTRRTLHACAVEHLTATTRAGDTAHLAVTAHHRERAGETEGACRDYAAVAALALERSQYAEAVGYSDIALALLTELAASGDVSGHDDSHGRLLRLRATALTASVGLGADITIEAWTQAYERLEEDAPPRLRAHLLTGLLNACFVRGDLEPSLQCTRELTAWAERHELAGYLQASYRQAAMPLMFLGDVPGANRAIDKCLQIIETHDVQDEGALFPLDARAAALTLGSVTRVLAGKANEAMDMASRGRERAQAHSGPFGIAQALTFTAVARVGLGVQLEFEHSLKELEDYISTHGLGVYAGYAGTFRAIAECVNGRGAAFAVDCMDDVTARYAGTGSRMFLVWAWGMLAEACLDTHAEEQARRATAEANRWQAVKEEPIRRSLLERLTGELHLLGNGGSAEKHKTEAEACFRRAVAIAREQGALLYQLKAATSLAQLLSVTGRESEAVHSLAQVCGHFEDGEDFPAIGRARELLRTLSSQDQVRSDLDGAP